MYPNIYLLVVFHSLSDLNGLNLDINGVNCG